MIGSTRKKQADLSDKNREGLNDNANKKVVGKFKDKMSCLIMTEFLTLNPKVYSFNHQTLGQQVKNKKTLKGSLRSS